MEQAFREDRKRKDHREGGLLGSEIDTYSSEKGGKSKFIKVWGMG